MWLTSQPPLVEPLVEPLHRAQRSGCRRSTFRRPSMATTPAQPLQEPRPSQGLQHFRSIGHILDLVVVTRSGSCGHLRHADAVMTLRSIRHEVRLTWGETASGCAVRRRSVRPGAHGLVARRSLVNAEYQISSTFANSTMPAYIASSVLSAYLYSCAWNMFHPVTAMLT